MCDSCCRFGHFLDQCLKLWVPNLRDTFRFRQNSQVITACPAGPDDANATLLSAKADWFRAAGWREQVV